ncbi:hypothetical protein [Actinomycetospora sp. CA-084318]|uniref:hypothetical protein n=1 Tax=Actinomycetospora sp. CA-084318 TaxID=3239892 RepID=UPI003D980AB1
MNDLVELARRVGEDRFRRACAQAYRDAPGTGRSFDVSEPDDPDLPHDLAEFVEGDLGLAIALYRAMPCYANLMYLDHWAPRPELLAELATLLDEPDDALADPVSYWLWCGPFEEDEQRSTAAWHQLTADAPEVRLRRLLDASGPVPWPAKALTFGVVLSMPEWHPLIWQAVRQAVHDYYGRVDAADALRLIDQLADPPPELDVADLQRRLRERRA